MVVRLFQARSITRSRLFRAEKEAPGLSEPRPEEGAQALYYSPFVLRLTGYSLAWILIPFLNLVPYHLFVKSLPSMWLKDRNRLIHVSASTRFLPMKPTLH